MDSVLKFPATFEEHATGTLLMAYRTTGRLTEAPALLTCKTCKRDNHAN